MSLFQFKVSSLSKTKGGIKSVNEFEKESEKNQFSVGLV